MRTKVMTSGEIAEKMKSGELKYGPIRHQLLPSDLRQRIDRLYKSIGHLLYQGDAAAWELGFMRDTNPHREVTLWEAIAEVFEHWMQNHPGEKQRQLVGELCSISFNGIFERETKRTQVLREKLRAALNKRGL